jgi:hypothetical protein
MEHGATTGKCGTGRRIWVHGVDVGETERQMGSVAYIDGHVEKRITKKADWTFEERGNTASDFIAKRCMKAAAADGISDAATRKEWNRQVEAQN